LKTILTLLYGDKYTVDDVHRIYDATNGKYNYVCLTDSDHAHLLRPEINVEFINKDFESHWKKIQLFSLTNIGKVLYLDLDIVIQSDIDVFFKYSKHPTVCQTYWKDFGSKFNSSVMTWNSKDCGYIFYHWLENPYYYMTKYNDNDDWFLYHEKLIQHTFPKGMIYSFLCGVDQETDTSPREFQIKPEYPIVLLNGQDETKVNLRQKYYDAFSMHKMG
jgi:hypothetical protein|tara:strand:+ start:40 stop:693 length:654 start_codon:yes stop_codon:yes gene_type:complete